MPAIDISSKKKIALVCSGGAVKAAAFHVGVVMALEDAGFRFLGGTREDNVESGAFDPRQTIQVYVGSSAGSLVSTFLAQGGKVKEILSSFLKEPSVQGIPGLKYWEMLFPRVRSKSEIFSFDNFLISMIRNKSLQSPFSTQGIANYLRSHIIKTEKFSDLEADLFIVATELNQSRKAIFGKYRAAPVDPTMEYRNDVAISDACAASMAIPPIYHPYSIQIGREKREYFDGEIREPLSSHIARDIGCDLIICSYTHQPVRYSRGSLAGRGVQEISLQAIYQMIEQKIQSSRGTRKREKNLIDTVRKFFKEKELPMEACEELIIELEARMTYKANVDYIYIRPKPTDHEMFLLPHFSLGRKHTERIVKKGYLAGATSLRGFKSEE